MTISTDPLLRSVLSLRIPEPSLYVLLDDYRQFLLSSGSGESFLRRLTDEIGFSDLALSEIEASVLASALMLSMDAQTDFATLISSAFPKPEDSDILALRREIVSRSISESKQIPSLAGISISLVRSRQADFCS